MKLPLFKKKESAEPLSPKQKKELEKKRKEILKYDKLDKKKIKRKKELGKKKILSIHKRAGRVEELLDKSGVAIAEKQLAKKMFNLTVAINFLLSMYLIYYFVKSGGYSFPRAIFILACVWLCLFFFILFLLWLFLYLIMDMRIFQRSRGIEEVLPDFLELTSANINAGMTIDKAMWYAVRPRFGVLAKEIEIVAKQTISGMDLEDALMTFSEKYDSPTLKRSINLLIEGIKAGGEIGELLNRISSNIKESQLMKKEMSADISSYAIFIAFATIAGAPFLLALAGQLIVVINKILSGIQMPESSGAIISISNSVSYTDFKIFAVVSLLITSFFSSVLVAIIKKGDVKAGYRYIPIFMTSTLIIYFIASAIMNYMFGSLL